VLYISDYDAKTVLAFPANERAGNAKPLATIPIGDVPVGLWVDRNGILYVAAFSAVYEFKPGATSPFQTITSGITEALSVAVDANGTLYVANADDKNVLVDEYAAGSTQPSLAFTITIPGTTIAFPGAMTFDPAGNLYVETAFESGGDHVFRFAPGATTGTDLRLEVVGGEDGLACDAEGNLYVGNGGSINIYRSGHKRPYKTVVESSTMPSMFALTRAGALYVPLSGNSFAQSSLQEFARHEKGPVNGLTGDFEEPVGAALQAEASEPTNFTTVPALQFHESLR